MEGYVLGLKQLSCRDLKAFNFFHKLSVYAVVCVIDEQEKKEQLQRQKTPVSRKGGGRPEWNHSMQFHLKGMSYHERADRLFLKFELRCGGVVFGDKVIGEVTVPLIDLIEEFKSSRRFVSYQVRNSDGKANGVLNFCYTVIGREKERIVEVESEENKVDCGQQLKLRLYPSLDDIVSPLPPIPCPSTTRLPTTDYFDAFPSLVQANAVPDFDCSCQYHYQWPCCNTREKFNACNYHLNVRNEPSY